MHLESICEGFETAGTYDEGAVRRVTAIPPSGSTALAVRWRRRFFARRWFPGGHRKIEGPTGRACGSRKSGLLLSLEFRHRRRRLPRISATSTRPATFDSSAEGEVAR